MPAQEGLVSLPKVTSIVKAGAKAFATLAVGAALAPLPLVAAADWAPPASAVGIASACGPGIESHNCPPLCAKLAGTVEPAKFFHVPLGKGVWHLYGEPQDVCTYAERYDPNSTVTDEVDGHQTVADFENQLSLTKKFNPKATVQAVVALGKYATDVVHCIGTGSSAWCYPNLVVFSKGYVVQAGEALNTVNLATMDKVYVPELVAWVKALLAQA